MVGLVFEQSSEINEVLVVYQFDGYEAPPAAQLLCTATYQRNVACLLASRMDQQQRPAIVAIVLGRPAMRRVVYGVPLSQKVDLLPCAPAP